MLQNKLVHSPGKAAETLIRHRHHCLRCLQPLTRKQLPVKTVRGDALHDAGEALQGTLGAGIVVTGINQVQAVGSPVILRGAGFREKETRIVPVGGKTGGAFIDHTALQNRHSMLAHFRNPASVKGGHLQISRQIHQIAHTLMYMDGFASGVFQHRASGHSAAENTEVQSQRLVFPGQRDLQRLPAAGRLGQT